VYVDEKNTYLEENPQIPSDYRLHSVFVDGEGRPVFVGDPGWNPKVNELLDSYLDTTTQ